jgi:hypothetical protein
VDAAEANLKGDAPERLIAEGSRGSRHLEAGCHTRLDAVPHMPRNALPLHRITQVTLYKSYRQFRADVHARQNIPPQT